jgi:hypothetical protein
MLTLLPLMQMEDGPGSVRGAEGRWFGTSKRSVMSLVAPLARGEL